MPLPELQAAARGVARQGIRSAVEGLRFVFRHPVLAATFLTDLDANLLGVPLALFPAINVAHFGGRPETLGFLNAAVGAGGLFTAIFSGATGRIARRGLGMLLGTVIWGVMIAGFGLTHSLLLAVGFLAVASAADTVTVTCRSSMVQALAPEEFRGRVSSVEYVIGVGGGPLGNFEAGTVAADDAYRERGERRHRLCRRRRPHRPDISPVRSLSHVQESR